MKRMIACILAVAVLFALCACGEAQESASEEASAAENVPVVLDSNEYNLYQNIFFNEMAQDYDGQQMTKVGVFASIFDSFNQRTRYYVWGYLDQTKCCDWQWEFVPTDASALPPSGSLVEMTGTFCAGEDALDGYWFTDASVTVKQTFSGTAGEVDLCTLNGTLERVQLINMQVFPQDYEGKTVRMYGRVYSPTEIQHPYYDNAWTQEFAAEGSVPPVGAVVTVSGTWTNGVITGAEIAETTDY